MLPQQLTPRGDWRVTAEAAPGSGPGPGQSKLTITGSNRGYLRQSGHWIIGMRQRELRGHTNIRRYFIQLAVTPGQVLIKSWKSEAVNFN